MIVFNARINDVDCVVFYDRRASLADAPDGYPYMYHLRHEETDWTSPVAVERHVAVNFMGTVFASRPMNLDSEGRCEVRSYHPDRARLKYVIPDALMARLLDG